jgi:hypothetical protein
MKNGQLKRDLKDILANQSNIKGIKKGYIGGQSIEVEYIKPISFDTYVYYDNEIDRDSDFEKLQNQIKE